MTQFTRFLLLIRDYLIYYKIFCLFLILTCDTFFKLKINNIICAGLQFGNKLIKWISKYEITLNWNNENLFKLKKS